MIRVNKSINTPAILTTKGVPTTIENCRQYNVNPAGYDAGKETFTIDPGIYGHEAVKQQLKADQHNKCCFCEADFTANGYGDVEHFRPKAGFTATRTSKLIRPGYYWLAYDWNNLFFSCQICNQRFKKNYFPLEDEKTRARNHSFDYRAEAISLIHPATDNPTDHITFNRHVPIHKTNRGKLSIVGYGIDRPKLNRVREAYLQNVRNNIAFAKVDLDTITEAEQIQYSRIMTQSWPEVEDLILKAKAFVQIAAKDDQPFSAMIQANFPYLI